MSSKRTNSELDLAEELASGFYLRTGRMLRPEVFLPQLQRKFNPYHDPDDGRFTFGPGGGGSTSFAGGRGSSRTIYPVRNRIPETTPGYPVRIDLPSPKPNVKPAAKSVFRFRHSAGLDLPDDVAERANALADAVSLRTGHRIHVSSGQRDARRQAIAMYDNYLQGNPPRYANRAAHGEVRRAFDRGRNGRAGRDAIIGAMAGELNDQMKRGIYLSRHMRGRAIDIRMPPAGVLAAIRRHPSVQSVGVEDDHLHIQFR